jgi:hypothetical protein
MLAFSICSVAFVNCACNSIIAGNQGVFASKFCIARISGAQVVVIAALWDVEATNFRIADIIGAFVVVIAQFSIVPALWKSGFAFLNF